VPRLTGVLGLGLILRYLGIQPRRRLKSQNQQ